jgi:hypothetical protein
MASKGRSTISTIHSVYIEVGAPIKKVQNWDGDYDSLDTQIVHAFRSKKVEDKFKKYNKYIKSGPIYFIALVLDPRIKGTFIETDYPDGKLKLIEIRQTIHKLYPANRQSTPADPTLSIVTASTFESNLLWRAHKTAVPESDIDRYFDTPTVRWNGKEDPDWLLN